MTKEEVVWAVAFGAYCAAQANSYEQADENEYWDAAWWEDAEKVANAAVEKFKRAAQA